MLISSLGFTSTLQSPCCIIGSRFRALPSIPHCSLLTKPGPCLSSNVAGQPLSTAKGLWLGQLLPNQQSDLPKADPKTNLFLIGFNLIFGQCSFVFLTRVLFFINSHVLKCAASVHSEPESNSNILLLNKKFFNLDANCLWLF